MGIYLYTTRISNPIKVKGLGAPIHKMGYIGKEYCTFLADHETKVYMDRMNRLMDEADTRWGENSPQYVVFLDNGEKTPEGKVLEVFASNRTSWMDQDPLGHPVGVIVKKTRGWTFIPKKKVPHAGLTEEQTRWISYKLKGAAA